VARVGNQPDTHPALSVGAPPNLVLLLVLCRIIYFSSDDFPFSVVSCRINTIDFSMAGFLNEIVRWAAAVGTVTASERPSPAR
jgi:hypothetical protein